MQNDNKHNNTPIDLTGKRLLVVGAGGFIGGFIAAEGVRRGMDVTVAVRESTSRRYLTAPGLHFLVLDYEIQPLSKNQSAPGKDGIISSTTSGLLNAPITSTLKK